MEKSQLILEIQRIASEQEGVPPGQIMFGRVTGIPRSSWLGRYWRNWGEALRDAGFEPNSFNKAYDKEFLISALARLTHKNRRFPTEADILMARRSDDSFPWPQTFGRLGTRNERIELMRLFAEENSEFKDILDLLPKQDLSQRDVSDGFVQDAIKEGFVYLCLMKVGREKRYKVGKAVLVERRRDQIAIQLPEELELIHTIRTDDAYGIESYWKSRFKDRNTKGEWFSLSREDVQAFKKRKFM